MLKNDAGALPILGGKLAVIGPLADAAADMRGCWAAAGLPKDCISVLDGLRGDDAAVHAAMRADKLMDQGDIEGFNMWNRVAAALNELDRPVPKDGEARH